MTHTSPTDGPTSEPPDGLGRSARVPSSERLRTGLGVAYALAILLSGGCGAGGDPGRDDQDAIVERAWLDDPDGTISPETAIGRAWTPFQGTLSRGYVTSTTWLRLRIDPAAAGLPDGAADRRLVLVVIPGHLDEVAVYRADRLSEPPAFIGDTHPLPATGQPLLSHTVVFEAASAPFEVLLRLRTQSTQSIDVQALRWDDARDKSLTQHVLVTGLLVFIAMVLA